MLTEQEVVNKVYQYFIVEGHPKAISNNGESCRYRTECGDKCAIGMFIPDDKYNPTLEGLSPHKIMELVPELEDILPSNFPFLRAVQKWHDQEFGDIEEFKELCDRYKLTYPGQENVIAN